MAAAPDSEHYGRLVRLLDAGVEVQLEVDLKATFHTEDRNAYNTLAELPGYQCPSGAFAFWKGACGSVSPFLTSYVLHVYQRAGGLGHP